MCERIYLFYIRVLGRVHWERIRLSRRRRLVTRRRRIAAKSVNTQLLVNLRPCLVVALHVFDMHSFKHGCHPAGNPAETWLTV